MNNCKITSQDGEYALGTGDWTLMNRKKPVLYIDDFLKTENLTPPTSEEKRAALSIIWARDTVKKKTIISAEWFLSELGGFDMAFASRISQNAELIQIDRDASRNYRLK